MYFLEYLHPADLISLHRKAFIFPISGQGSSSCLSIDGIQSLELHWNLPALPQNTMLHVYLVDHRNGQRKWCIVGPFLVGTCQKPFFLDAVFVNAVICKNSRRIMSDYEALQPHVWKAALNGDTPREGSKSDKNQVLLLASGVHWYCSH